MGSPSGVIGREPNHPSRSDNQSIPCSSGRMALATDSSLAGFRSSSGSRNSVVPAIRSAPWWDVQTTRCSGKYRGPVGFLILCTSG